MNETFSIITNLKEFAELSSYSLMETLNCDPEAKINQDDYFSRQVFSGHYVPVKPTPLNNPEYVTHSKKFFEELGIKDDMALSDDFIKMFSGDLSMVPEPIKNYGWATGYALSIYGTEYYQQCPFQTGNGYGDGRAISIFEALIKGRRWEMQLKGGGPTPYCRGGDGRAVLRSSVREFLAQEHMHALKVPTSRSLSLYVSKTQTVKRPWYSPGSSSMNPDILVADPIAISTRVAPSFIRVGQLELFGRRARKNEHPKAMDELEKIVLHLLDREYSEVISKTLLTPEKVVLLAQEFRIRLTSLIANWIRVGFCQGNFNSDNCAAGGFTLDYGPFGFCEVFSPQYQPWIGGGLHYSFMNQPAAAERNFFMFCTALMPLLANHQKEQKQLEEIRDTFVYEMDQQIEKMWSAKLGLVSFDANLYDELISLMTETPVDYTIFFRELSALPENIEPLKKSFYKNDNFELEERWMKWLESWNSIIDSDSTRSREQISKHMKLVNPKYSWREWFVVPAYQQAAKGDYALIRELQVIMNEPYAEQSKEIEAKYYRLKPLDLFEIGGYSHYSCSS